MVAHSTVGGRHLTTSDTEIGSSDGHPKRSRTTDDEGRSGARMGALPQHPETDFTDTPGPFWGFLFGTNDE